MFIYVSNLRTYGKPTQVGVTNWGTCNCHFWKCKFSYDVYHCRIFYSQSSLDGQKTRVFMKQFKLSLSFCLKLRLMYSCVLGDFLSQILVLIQESSNSRCRALSCTHRHSCALKEFEFTLRFLFGLGFISSKNKSYRGPYFGTMWANIATYTQSIYKVAVNLKHIKCTDLHLFLPITISQTK